MFNKPAHKLATYKPPGVSEAAKPHADTHWQLEYIMTNKSNIKIENCETDSKSSLQSDHYPVTAEMKIKHVKILLYSL